jgi:hypothetical protein
MAAERIGEEWSTLHEIVHHAPQTAANTTGAATACALQNRIVCGVHAGGGKRDPPWRGWGGAGDVRIWRLRAIVAFWARVISVSVALRGSAVRCLRTAVLPMYVVKNVSNGRAGPSLVKERCWRGERACLRDAPPFLGNFLMPLSCSEIRRTAC